MILSDEKIIVTHKMMVISNMTRGSQYGIPVDPITGKGGIVWRSLSEMQDEDFDAIEEYFIHRSGL